MVQLIHFLARTISRNRFRTNTDLNSCDSCWSISSAVRISGLDDGLLLFHTSTGRLFTCNRVGARIWVGITSGLTLEAIAQNLALDYGAKTDQTSEDVHQFLLSLAQHRLITRKVAEP